MYQTIVQAVLAHAKETPDKLAIGFKKIRVTYGELGIQVRAFAQKLQQEFGIEKGDFIYDKIFLYEDERSDLKSFLEYTKGELEALDRGSHTYEVIQKGYTKATACRFIMEKFGINPKNAYVFGDSSNDLAMFQFVEHAVAMGNHDPVLDPYAEFVTKTVEEDGIAFAMEHYGLIE